MVEIAQRRSKIDDAREGGEDCRNNVPEWVKRTGVQCTRGVCCLHKEHRQVNDNYVV